MLAAHPPCPLVIDRCGRCGARLAREYDPIQGDYEIKCDHGHTAGYVDTEGRLTLVGRTPPSPWTGSTHA